jgi:signal transduction histidine kinase
LGEFISSVTHGLGNNMANIISNASGIQDECVEFEKDLADCAEFSAERTRREADEERIRRKSAFDELHGRLEGRRDRIMDYSGRLLKRMNELDGNIKALLNFARPNQGHRMSVDLNNIIEEAVSIARSCQDGRVTFIKSLDRYLPVVHADPIQVKGMVVDLILNAIQSISSTGTIVYETKSLSGEQRVRLRISDTGVGIKEEDQKKIFTPFFTTRRSGTGLGLANVKNMVKQNGGSISFVSEEGKGTTFNIEFPAAETI